MPAGTKSGGTIKSVTRTGVDGDDITVVVEFPNPAPPPETETVTYEDVIESFGSAFERALGKDGVTVNVTTNSADKIVGVKTVAP